MILLVIILSLYPICVNNDKCCENSGIGICEYKRKWKLRYRTRSQKSGISASLIKPQAMTQHWAFQLTLKHNKKRCTIQNIVKTPLAKYPLAIHKKSFREINLTQPHTHTHFRKHLKHHRNNSNVLKTTHNHIFL